MKWNEVDLFVPKEATDSVALLLYECGSNGSVIHDDETDEENRIRITAYFSEEQQDIRERLQLKLQEMQQMGLLAGSFRIRTSIADDESWMYAWQEYFHPKKISPLFWAEPAWERACPKKGEMVLTIDPGLAFGSGFHETTCLCVEFLENAVKPGQLVIDIGTGTGILAIAAAKLGAHAVRAVDLDEKAVAQAKKNIPLNGVEDCVTVSCSDLLAAVPEEKAQVIVANIVADAILMLLPAVGPYLQKDGIFIASGIIDERIDEVRQKAAACGFIWDKEELRNGWYAVQLRWPS